MNRHISNICHEYDIHEDALPKTHAERMKLAHHILQQRIDKLHHAQWAIGAKLLELAAEALGCANDDIEYEPGHMECECKDNPIGECVYHGHEDPAWDDCLFCHQPWERK